MLKVSRNSKQTLKGYAYLGSAINQTGFSKDFFLYNLIDF